MTEPAAPIEQNLAPATNKTQSPNTDTDTDTTALDRVHLPRIAIEFCTQCRWMLRAAYFAQELLTTFSTDLGEVALVPVTGGVFTVTIWHAGQEGTTQGNLLWDRKRDGGFPEVKALKSLVRNVIAPGRDLGHTDRALRKKEEEEKKEQKMVEGPGKEGGKKECDDCS